MEKWLYFVGVFLIFLLDWLFIGVELIIWLCGLVDLEVMLELFFCWFGVIVVFVMFKVIVIYIEIKIFMNDYRSI